MHILETLLIKYHHKDIAALQAEIKKLFVNINVQFIHSGSDACKDSSTGISVLPAEELRYPEHLELPLISVLEICGKKLCFIGNVKEQEPLRIVHNEDIRKKLGKVFLIGAGQSTKDLLTLRANRLLKEADIVFYDSLIDNSILSDTKAKLVFVGKRAGAHHQDQDSINQLLKNAALEHKTIVRIKGGDPMIFGHAGEEIAFLEENFIQVEVIPGITSALGAAAVTKTPLTLRNVSTSVSFCTAHQKSKIPVPQTDTIVYFMGAGNMINVAKELLNRGLPASTPMKLVYNIGGNDQEIYDESVGSLMAEDKTFKAPLLAIVGEVANKKNWYKAFQYKQKILFTGTNISKYADLGYVQHHPMIKLEALNDFTEVDKSILAINTYNWLLFTSAYSVKFFFERLFELNKDTRSLQTVKVASIGSVTSAKLKNFGVIPDVQAKEESSDGIIQLFKDEKIYMQSILLPRSNLAHNYLPKELQSLGNHVAPLVIYNNVKPKIQSEVDPEKFDQVIFTSPSGVDNFIEQYGSLPKKPELISRGKETSKSIDKYRVK